jgi:hypothetical protein
MAMLRATRGKALAFRAIAHHLVDRLPAKEWAEALSVGLQDTPPGSAIQGLAARVEDVTPEMWETERVSSRNLVVSWSLRGAPYAHLIEDHDAFSVAARPTGEQAWLTFLAWTRHTAESVGMRPAGAVALTAAHAEGLLMEGPMNKADLSTELREVLPSELLPWCRACKVHHVPDQVLRAAGLFGGLVIGDDDVEGRFTIVRPDQWMGTLIDKEGWAWRQPDKRTARQQRLELVHRYLSAYGPADAPMFANWLGVNTAEAAHRFAEAHQAGHLVDVAGPTPDRAMGWLHVDDVDDFLAIKASDARGVRLLPPSDPYLQQRDRHLLIEDPARQKEVWKPVGSPGVLIVDAAPAGTWRARKQGSKLTVAVRSFEPLRPRDIKRVESEAAYVARVRDAELADVTIAG